ncbi:MULTISPECIES: hypothetical protein [unclassified Amycolatopsis]|uniref:hypothetical protein n=1 Tax=unclassified Amycolatopsis TaxID=2618356 RepID=UPI002874D0D7|nr:MULTISPECIES: hypothetical protein [unclassified Amycolatopsis]MDS0136327.1 hypothetical protein [Amycolatopsis sp. 505]MDS0145842.1 hypothetical protein [Amycolatopsis sp. CM201R]
MTSGPVIVAALVLAAGAGRLLRHLGGSLGRRPTERSTEMTRSTPTFPLRIYHWRWEILAVTLLPYAVVTFALWAGPLWASAVLATALGLAVLRRRQVQARIHAIRLQHRLRAVFPHLRLPGGRLPAILWSRPRGGDIVVSLYGREAFEHLHRHRTVLAAACAVPEVYVDRHPRYASLVTLTISPTAPKREPSRASLPSNVVPLRAHS